MQLAAQDMTLVNEDCVCGLCGTIGPNVTHSPGTISRIGQALNISKYELPSSLTKLGRIEKAGLCNNCEHKVKILEDAANIRVNLTESLYSKEQHPTIPGYPTKNGLPPGNGGKIQTFSNPHAIRKANEVTPAQHSLKRKISHIAPRSSNGDPMKTKQLKTRPNDFASNHSENGIDLTNSSDEENALMINESASLSPHSSMGSYTPPSAHSPLNGIHYTNWVDSRAPQVLSELPMCRGNRRKQARPAKAAVVAPMPPHLPFDGPSPYYNSARVSKPTVVSIADSIPTEPLHVSTTVPSGFRQVTPPPSVGTLRLTPPTSLHAQLPTSLPVTSQPLTNGFGSRYPVTTHMMSEADQRAKQHNSLMEHQYQLMQACIVKNFTNGKLKPGVLMGKKPSSTITSPSSNQITSSSTPAASTSNGKSTASSLPFLPFPPLYAGGANAFGPQSLLQSTTTSGANSALLAQSFNYYNAATAAANKGANLMGVNNSLMLGGIGALTNGSLPFHNSATASNHAPSVTSNLSTNLNLLMAAKKEPKPPLLGFGAIAPGASASLLLQPDPSTSTDNPDDETSTNAEAHFLRKTDKRRYCKVCTTSLRKANNGRPPQSRFLCDLCNMPMCRSCIEEHRLRIRMMEVDGEKPEIKPSASAKLLEAVKMKDSAGSSPRGTKTGQSTQSTSNSVSSTNRSLSALASQAPPSHSSLIYGPLSFQTPHPNNTMAPRMPGLFSNISLPALPTLTAAKPLDMRLPTYQTIAPAPPTLSVSPAAAAAGRAADMVVKHEPTDITVKVEEVDDEEVPLVISECLSDGETVSCSSSSATSDVGHSTDITPEVASQTVAMLLSLDEDPAANTQARDEPVAHDAAIKEEEIIASSNVTIPTTIPTP